MFAAACMFHPDIRVPFSAFFAKDSGHRCESSVKHAGGHGYFRGPVCVEIGVAPIYLLGAALLGGLPAIFGLMQFLKLQLLMFSALVFCRVGEESGLSAELTVDQSGC